MINGSIGIHTMGPILIKNINKWRNFFVTCTTRLKKTYRSVVDLTVSSFDGWILPDDAFLYWIHS